MKHFETNHPYILMACKIYSKRNVVEMLKLYNKQGQTVHKQISIKLLWKRQFIYS